MTTPTDPPNLKAELAALWQQGVAEHPNSARLATLDVLQ
jgi:hypothetical protein